MAVNRGHHKERCLHVLDVLLAMGIVFPLVIFYWRGTWDLWDVYCKVDCLDETSDDCSELTGNWISSGIGISLCIILNSVSPLMERSSRKCGTTSYHLTARLYMYIYAFAYLGQWRGVWNLIDEYSDYEWKSNVTSLSVCLVLMTLLRLNRFWSSAPWGINMELDRCVFQTTPWLKTKADGSWWHYCVDHSLSQIVVLNLNIAIWRSIWNILDSVILPEQPDLSAAVTLSAGAIWFLFLYAIQFPATKYAATLDNHPVRRTAFESMFYVLVNICILFMWRGFWNLKAKYVLPDQLVGGWTCHALGTAGLMLLLCFRTIFDNSVSQDGDMLGGMGINPDMRITRRMIQHHEKQRKVESQTERELDSTPNWNANNIEIKDHSSSDWTHTPNGRNIVVSSHM